MFKKVIVYEVKRILRQLCVRVAYVIYGAFCAFTDIEATNGSARIYIGIKKKNGKLKGKKK